MSFPKRFLGICHITGREFAGIRLISAYPMPIINITNRMSRAELFGAVALLEIGL